MHNRPMRLSSRNWVFTHNISSRQTYITHTHTLLNVCTTCTQTNTIHKHNCVNSVTVVIVVTLTLTPVTLVYFTRTKQQ